MGEVALAALLCSLLDGGQVEVKQDFLVQGDLKRRYVDCQTETHLFEIGVDGSSDLRDSVHQAVLYAHLSAEAGKPIQPMILIIDTDGVEDAYQYEMRIVTSRLGIPYAVCHEDFIVRWKATEWLRRNSIGDDLPPLEIATQYCDIEAQLDQPKIPDGYGLIGSDKPPLGEMVEQPVSNSVGASDP